MCDCGIISTVVNLTEILAKNEQIFFLIQKRYMYIYIVFCLLFLTNINFHCTIFLEICNFKVVSFIMQNFLVRQFFI